MKLTKLRDAYLRALGRSKAKQPEIISDPIAIYEDQLVEGCDYKGLIRAYMESCCVYLPEKDDHGFFTGLAQGLKYLTPNQHRELRAIIERGPQ